MRPIYILTLIAVLLLPTVAVAKSDQVIPNGVRRIDAYDGSEAIDVDVAVIDTGIQYDNYDLNVVGGVDCTPLMDDDNPNYPPALYEVQGRPAQPLSRPILNPLGPDWDDGHAHGTHVAGTIAALDNNLGVVGVAPGARLWSVRVLNSVGYGTDETVNCGLKWVKRHADVIDVVNMSLGYSGLYKPAVELYAECREPNELPDPRLISGMISYSETWQLICDIRDLGIPVVVAAGNDDNEAIFNEPAGFPEAITVSNFADFDGLPGGLASYHSPCPQVGGWDDQLFAHLNNTPHQDYTSSYGRGVDIAAPGTCVLSTVPGGFAYFTGTSMAAPHVTGVVARLKAQHPDATVDEIEAMLLEMAQPQEDSFNDIDYVDEPLLNWSASE